MTAIINQRWPRDLCPQSCVFERTRNDILQVSPSSRKRTVIRQGRPLWTAKCSWRVPNTTKLARLRYFMEALEGFAGSVQIWDFASPYPWGIDASVNIGSALQKTVRWQYLATQYPFVAGGIPSHWRVDLTPPTLTTGVAVGASSIAIGGLEASKYAVVQGQYVQVGRRLYLAASDAIASAGGTATIQLMSPVLAAANAGDPVRLVEAACEMQLAEQAWTQTAEAATGVVTFTASFIESVEDVT